MASLGAEEADPCQMAQMEWPGVPQGAILAASLELPSREFAPAEAAPRRGRSRSPYRVCDNRRLSASFTHGSVTCRLARGGPRVERWRRMCYVTPYT